MMKRFWVVLIALFSLSIAGLGALWLSLRQLDPRVAIKGDVLYWIVDGAYPEQRDESPFSWIVSGTGPTHIEMLQAIQAAAYDPDIDGLFLEIHALPANLAQVQEYIAALKIFGREGKTVQAWLSSGGNREYLLAMSADEIVLAPEGQLLIPGLSAELTFLAGTLEKLGMKADYVHVGRYKSAPESYELRGPSAPHQEMIDALLDDQFAWLVATVASDRALPSESVAALIDHGLYDAGEALEAGLVDDIAYLPDTLDDVFPTGETVDLEDYAMGRSGQFQGPGVALIHITGAIVNGESSPGGWQGASAGCWTIIDRLQAAYDDHDVKAVLLRVDSPGGSALASDLIWNEIQALQEIKPVVVSMGGMAASGGYYVACGADSIFASAGTITGSIGVFSGKMDRSGFYAKIGVTRTFVTRGRNALLYADEATFTDEQRVIISGQLEAFYDRFVAKVADARGLSPSIAASSAEGRVWSGRQGLDLGLVDGLGGFQRSEASIRTVLGLPPRAVLNLGGDVRSPSFLERVIMKSLRNDQAIVAPALIEASAGLGGLVPFVSLFDGRPLALQPVRVELH